MAKKLFKKLSIVVLCSTLDPGHYQNQAKVPTLVTNQLIMSRKALPGFFLCIFSSLTCLKKTVFNERDPLQCKVLAQAILGSSDQRKVPTSLLLFLKP
jgi:hypothetical protein